MFHRNVITKNVISINRNRWTTNNKVISMFYPARNFTSHLLMFQQLEKPSIWSMLNKLIDFNRGRQSIGCDKVFFHWGFKENNWKKTPSWKSLTKLRWVSFSQNPVWQSFFKLPEHCQDVWASSDVSAGQPSCNCQNRTRAIQIVPCWKRKLTLWQN